MVTLPHIEKHLQLLHAMGLPEASGPAVQAALTKATLAGMGLPSLGDKGVASYAAGDNATLPNLGGGELKR